jgi:hypothetical protein
MTTKFQITALSENTAQALFEWAEMERRPVSGLVAFLLELGIAKAEQEGMMPQPVADVLRFRVRKPEA